MTAAENRRMAMVLGLVGALLIVLEAVVDLVSGVVFVAFGRGYQALGAVEQSFLLVVVGLLIGFFAFLGRSHGGERSLASGVVLIVLVLVGWLVLGFTSGVLALLGSVFVLVGGILFVLAGQ